MSDPNSTAGLPAGAENKPQIQPYEYTLGIMCQTCGNKNNCKLGKYGDKGCCKLYTDGGKDDE